MLVPEQLGGYPNILVGAYKVAAELLVPEQRGGYPPCCWYRKSGVAPPLLLVPERRGGCHGGGVSEGKNPNCLNFKQLLPSSRYRGQIKVLLCCFYVVFVLFLSQKPRFYCILT